MLEFQKDKGEWGNRFSSAWRIFVNPSRAFEAVMPIPAEATALDLAFAWRAALGEESNVAEVVGSLREDFRDTAGWALRELQRRISVLPGSSEEAGLILAKDFGGQRLPLLELPDDEDYCGPRAKMVSVAPIKRLSQNHFLRSYFRDSDCWEDSEDGPCLVLGPTLNAENYAKPFYLLETVQTFTRSHRSWQLARQRKHEASLRLQVDLEQQAREANPLFRARRLETENAELRQRVESLERKMEQ